MVVVPKIPTLGANRGLTPLPLFESPLVVVDPPFTDPLMKEVFFPNHSNGLQEDFPRIGGTLAGEKTATPAR